MRPISYFDLIIFDCDGVIIDSNELKIKAMGEALNKNGVAASQTAKCKAFFAAHFGKSRLYHINYFVKNILDLDKNETTIFKQQLLEAYSSQCKKLYLSSNLTPLVEKFLRQNKSIKYVASGSEQDELREVFKHRKLETYFVEILGSPEKKTVHVTNILKNNINLKAVMIGDAVSDLEAAKDNDIDFIFYSPFSNVETKMRELCEKYGYRILDSFEEVIE